MYNSGYLRHKQSAKAKETIMEDVNVKYQYLKWLVTTSFKDYIKNYPRNERNNQNGIHTFCVTKMLHPENSCFPCHNICTNHI